MIVLLATDKISRKIIDAYDEDHKKEKGCLWATFNSKKYFTIYSITMIPLANIRTSFSGLVIASISSFDFLASSA